MAKKRTKAERSAAAKASWERRRQGLPPLTKQKKRRKLARGSRTQPPVSVAADMAAAAFSAPGYEMLAAELQHAFSQSAHGKGKQRHSNGRPFDRQPIMEIGRMVGPGYTAGQAQKKAQEALGMLSRGEKEKALAEIHGAIVYLAATAALIREKD